MDYTKVKRPIWPHAEQTRIFRRFQQTFRDYDLVLAPTVPVSPFPWTQLYLAELEGQPLKNYCRGIGISMASVTVDLLRPHSTASRLPHLQPFERNPTLRHT